MSSNDPFRKYCTNVEGKKNALKCGFCGNVFGGGGITRFKYYLSGMDPTVEVCAFRYATGPFGSSNAVASRTKCGQSNDGISTVRKPPLSVNLQSEYCRRRRPHHLVSETGIRDREAELDDNTPQDPLDIVQRSMERINNADEDILVHWIRPVHLDDELGNPDLDVIATARSVGIDVDRVMNEEVGTENSGSSSHGGGDNDEGESFAGDSATRGGTRDGGGYSRPTTKRSAGGYSSHEGRMPQHAPWTEKQGFDRCTQDTDHGARDSSMYGRSFDRRRRGMSTSVSSMFDSTPDEDALSLSFESMGIPPFEPPYISVR